jgi:alkanesulfonate monooxygenase SsuD/methylene tetrahydromethanopterin reductase-like flavin-dependent oxidoreductase (luciferase family)
MDVGLALPQFDYNGDTDAPAPWDATRAAAERAGALGFSSVWLADHLFLSMDFKYGGPPGRHRAADPLVLLAAIARSVPDVQIGTLVLCAQLRPPRVLAKALATLDRVSGGRLVAGLGAGWYEPEYVEAGVPFERAGVRLRQLADTVETVREMFTTGATRPPPGREPGPPLWVGGRGDRLLDVVAGHADGWNTVWAWTPQDYKARLDVLHRACDRVGRDPATVALSLGLTTLVGEDEADLARRFELLHDATPHGVLTQDLATWRRDRLVGTPEQVREQMAGWADLGVSTLILCQGALPFGVSDPDDLELVASALPEE